MKHLHTELAEKGLINSKQSEYIDKITSRSIISLFYELRSLLYLGVLLFTAGVGFLIYQNMDRLSHLFIISILIIIEGACVYYLAKNAVPFSKEKVNPPTPYFDYILLLAALLFVSILSYIFILNEVSESMVQWSSLATSLLFLAVAYRMDHRGILALAITIFSAFWGISVSPKEWMEGGVETTLNLFNITILLGALYTGIGIASERLNFKAHFSFTYKNFGLLLLYIGIIAGYIENDAELFYNIFGLIVSPAIAVYSWKNEENLFFLYSVLASYIHFTAFLIIVDIDLEEGWLMYGLMSAIGLIVLVERLVRRKSKKNKS